MLKQSRFVPFNYLFSGPVFFFRIFEKINSASNPLELTHTLKIAIAEDKELFRENLVRALNPFGIQTIIQAANGRELLDALQHQSPDIILLDLRMPVMDGSRTLAHLRDLYPRLRVIILSSFNEKILIEDLIRRGAWGYVTKDELSADPGRLVTFMAKVHSGNRHITLDKENSTLRFSEIQKDIIQMEGKGLAKKEISQTTGLTENAVRKQVRKIMEKFGVSTLAAFYIRLANSGFEFLRLPAKKTAKK